MSGYILHPEAYNDIDGLWEFIATDNLDAADRVREEIYETIQALVALPHQGHRRPDLTARPVRFMRVRDFLIAYAPDEKPLLIHAVIHGRRNPRVLAAILRIELKLPSKYCTLRPGFLLASGSSLEAPRSQKRDLGHPLINDHSRHLHRLGLAAGPWLSLD